MKRYMGKQADYLICNTTIKNCNNIENVKDALHYAIDIINSYEIDIRNSNWIIEQYPEEATINLVELGFCQGSIYKTVYTTMVNILQK
jgi:hypothetical protein